MATTRPACKVYFARSKLVALCLFAGFSVAAAARDHLYGVIDNADLIVCEDQYWRGELSAATSCYRTLAGSSPSALLRAEALWGLDDLQGANTLYQTAFDLEPENAVVRLRWAELFLRTFQYQEAYNLFAEALTLDPENAHAHAGAARALAQGGGDREEVTAHMMAVAENIFAAPGAQMRVQLMMIRSALEQDRFDNARELLDEALALANTNMLPKFELHALEASLAFMTLQPHQPHIDAALAEAPASGAAWATLGQFASNVRRYKESGEFYLQAVTLQPNLWEAHLELGQNYLRLNQVTPAAEHVRTSYAGDAFNPKTVNMLRLLDTFLEDMDVLTFPDPPAGAFPSLVLRLGKSETEVMRDYAQELSEQSIAAYSERYRFTPKEPVIVEIYPNHEDFVVRSIGMPGVGILGVTFGYLFAMDSPTAHPRGEAYHWGTTLWHEMAHVFTLEATNHMVPRWFSEGISVFEEWRTGPIPGRKIPLNVLQAMAEGKFLPIAQLDDGFMRPTYEDQVIVSYMQAGLVFEFIDLDYGFDKIVDILYQFNDGTSAVTAIERTLGISAADFDAQFKQFVDIEYGPMLGRMPTWQEDHRAAFAALAQEDWQGAIAAAERANFIYPDYVEPDSPYIAMARAYLRLEDKDGEFRTLETFWQRGGYSARALLTLGDHYLERDNREQALEVFTDVLWADPFNQPLHDKLGDLHMARNEPAKALREYEVLLALNPLDKASANLKIATAYKALNNLDKTMEYLMTALDIAPQYRPAQQLLLELTRAGTGQPTNTQ